MKDEEMAEQFADNMSGFELTCSLLAGKNKIQIYRLGRYEGFLAGLKAGRPQWHDLRKDPNDLPKFRRDILVTCEYRSKLKIKRETFEWDYNSEMPLHAIAWCEIPTFDKESE